MFELFDKITGSSVGKSPVVPLSRTGKEWNRVRAAITLQDPKLWSPEFPELYLLKCYVVIAGKDKEIRTIDEYDLTYGLRDFAVSDGDFRLNGNRIVLKGVVWQEDHPTWGSAMTYEDLERDVVLIKNLGANAIRFGSHPPHPYMLNLCDRYGLLALQEIPLVDAPASAMMHEEYLELATTAMREMIMRDRNHPSMIAWGIGDQFESFNPAVRPFVQSLVQSARALDTRPLYATSRVLSIDACSDLVDIPAIAVSAQDPKQFKQQVQDWKNRNQGRVLLVSRFGTEVQSGNRNGYSDPLSYEAQSRFYIQRFDMLKSLAYDGALISSLSDWKGDRPALTVNTGDPWMHTMGLVSYQREKRLAYEAVRSIFRSEKFVALPIGNFMPSAPIIYVLAGLVVLIGVAYLYNASRRFREALNRSLLNSFNFFADVRDQRVVSVIHSTLLGIIVSVATAIVISSVLYHFRGSWVLDNMLSYVLVYDNIKEAAVRLIWHPLQSILYLSMVFFVGLLLIAAGMLAVSPLFKSRIYPFHAYAITMWSTPPLIALVPLGMILFRLMETTVYVIPSLVIVAGLLAWVVLRLFKGISIIFDTMPARVYFVGVVGLVAVAALGYLYYDYTQSTSAYLSFMYNTAAGSR
jgi:beta-galactosidase